jgi:diacylglycerol O-acyltransferase / wax synthase
MDRLSPLDASFLHIEDGSPVSHMHIASVAIFEGPPPPYDDLLSMVEGKLPLVPRYRQVVRMVPLNLGRPVWVDDPHFNARYHMRHSALPSPGGEEQLRRLVGRVMAQQLDRSKPLWEIWIVEGLEDGRWAMLSKVHHAMVDGVSGSDLLAVILDRQREPGAPVADRWAAGPLPSAARVVGEALAERTVNPYEMVRGVRAMLRAPRQLAGQLAVAGQGLLAMRSLLRPTTGSSLNGPIGPHRRYAWARATLADVKAVRAGLGGTVNDVVLTIIAGGFRDLLLSRGESLERPLRTMVPVSVRTSGERGTYNNKVSAMFADLPIEIDDPVARLESVKAQMQGLKESKQAVAGEVLTSLSGFAPPMLLALGTRLATRLPQRNLHTVTTNVPGPQEPLYAAGRQMLEAYPYVPLAGSVRIGVAIFSYNGNLSFGVTGDYDSAPDIEVLCQGIEAGLAELVSAGGTKAAKENGGTAPRKKPAAKKTAAKKVAAKSQAKTKA